MRIKIQSTNDLILFIREFQDLNFTQCAEVVDTYLGKPIYWLETDNKEDLISFLKNHSININSSRIQVPLFGDGN